MINQLAQRHGRRRPTPCAETLPHPRWDTRNHLVNRIFQFANTSCRSALVEWNVLSVFSQAGASEITTEDSPPSFPRPCPPHPDTPGRAEREGRQRGQSADTTRCLAWDRVSFLMSPDWLMTEEGSPAFPHWYFRRGQQGPCKHSVTPGTTLGRRRSGVRWHLRRRHRQVSKPARCLLLVGSPWEP